MDNKTLNKAIDEGSLSSFRENNDNFLEKTDSVAVEEVVREQIEFLGSELLYQRINKNFLEHKFEAFFAKEQFKLFTWRENFFHIKLGKIWIKKLDGDFDLMFETVPYHLTKNFQEVIALACSTKHPSYDRPHNVSYVMFENYDELSTNARAMFDPFYRSIVKNELQGSGLTFKDVTAMIMARHRVGPCTLLENAMKAVLLHGLPIDGLPRELQEKALHGLYSDNVRLPVPSNLSIRSEPFPQLQGGIFCCV